MFSIGIVGLPNVGKSTLFNTLTKKQVDAANYPFCTIDPNIGVVSVPDERLEKLAAVSHSQKIIPAAIEFIDIAGLVAGASKGEGLGNKFLSHIRACDAICEVVREFKDPNIIHVSNKVNPEEDRQTINLELILADLETVSRALEKTGKEARSGSKEIIVWRDCLEKLKQHLENEQPARSFEVDEEVEKQLKTLNLLTRKPLLYVLNCDEAELKKPDNPNWDGKVIKMSVKIENEIAMLSVQDQKEYLQELGLEKSGLDRLIQASYNLLGLLSFLTTGQIETRAWTIRKGAKAPQAAGVIHSDFEKNFIRAEIINWQDFINCNGEQTAREKGLLRTEGKDYIMKEGDVCNFLIGK